MKILIIFVVVVAVVLVLVFLRGAKKNDDINIIKKDPPKGW